MKNLSINILKLLIIWAISVLWIISCANQSYASRTQSMAKVDQRIFKHSEKVLSLPSTLFKLCHPDLNNKTPFNILGANSHA